MFSVPTPWACRFVTVTLLVACDWLVLGKLTLKEYFEGIEHRTGRHVSMAMFVSVWLYCCGGEQLPPLW